MKYRVLGLLLVSTVALMSCAHRGSLFVGWFKDLKDCRAEYAAMDARVDAAGVRDAQYYRVPGFPYLRSDRLLASFASEVSGLDQVGGWIRHLRENDQEAREFEYMNLGFNIHERGIQRDRFLKCGAGLAGLELEDPAEMKKLIAAVQPPDDYSPIPRALGVYALAAAGMKERIVNQQAEIKRQFAQPLTDAAANQTLMLWQARPSADRRLVEHGFDTAYPDEMGLPGMTDSQWLALAEVNAPQLWMETASAQDQPGAPMLSTTGAIVDTSKPVINYQINFTRFGGQPLVQINYFVWFSGRSDARGIDGLIWRVTLDAHAKPLVYESLRASGREHLWFPVQPLSLRDKPADDLEPALIPQEQVPSAIPVVRLSAGTHVVRRVLAAEQVSAAETRRYELRRYEDLFFLPAPAGGTRSLFGPDGRVPGTHAPDPLWQWASGISDPGALRQYGHQPMTYVGRQHFDDAFLLDSVFVPPWPARPTVNTAAASPG